MKELLIFMVIFSTNVEFQFTAAGKINGKVAVEISENVDHHDVPPATLIKRIDRYFSSIKFWDTKDAVTRRNIVRQLVEENDGPHCPSNLYPLICDSDGSLLENSCIFRVKRTEKLDLLPILIFDVTSIKEARKECKRLSKGTSNIPNKNVSPKPKPVTPSNEQISQSTWIKLSYFRDYLNSLLG